MTKRILVTGGLGFIGSNLCRGILQTSPGCDLTIIDNLSGTITDWHDLEGGAKIDIADLRTLDPSRATFDEVWHLASPVGSLGILDRAGTIASDILDLASHAHRVAEASNASLLYVSSSEVYGHDGKHDEDVDLVVPNRHGARMEYALGKLAAEHALYNRCLSSGQRLTVVRPFNCAGPGQSQELGFVFPTFVRAALEGRPLPVHSDGSARRAFCHVDDMVNGLLAVQEHGKSGRVYNVGQPQGVITIHDLALKVIDQLGSDSAIEFVDPNRVFGPHWTEAFDKLPDIKRVKQDTGWAPTRNLEQIIGDVAASIPGPIDI